MSDNIFLSGFSGCKLEVVQSHGRIFVRKTSANVEYNERLKSQSIKQALFSSKTFRSVKVYESDYDDNGLFWFAMEYINGTTMANYMKSIDLSEIPVIAKQVISMIPGKTVYDCSASSVFSDKIKSLEEYIKNLNDDIICDAYNILKLFSWEYISKSYCHGDLTFENMIISNGQIYIFDFLDSFYDSWIIDFAKLLQDVELHWAYRFEKIDNNLFVRLLVFRDILLDSLMNLNNGRELTETLYYVLLLNLLRILPYADGDTYTKLWIKRKVFYLLNKIKTKQWRYSL